MNDNIFQKFRDKFFEEANMLLDRFENEILQLEKTPDDRGLNESVFRAMHTIKGISAMYGFEYISELTHLLENVFQNLNDGKIRFSKEISEISLLSIDHIHKLLNDEKLLNNELRLSHTKLVEQVNRIANSKRNELPALNTQEKYTQSLLHTWLIIINTSEQMYFRGINLNGICAELFAMGECKIVKIPVLNTNKSDSWGIILVSDTTEDNIREVLMFIEDECSVFTISNYDIFNSYSNSIKETKDFNQNVYDEQSIITLVEKKDSVELFNEPEIIITENDLEKQTSVRKNINRISVETGKLDDLMYLVSQFITLNSHLNVAHRDKDYQKLRDYIGMLDSLSKQFRNNALEIRLVPLGDVALRFQRLVRDLSKSMGKKIEFVTEGIDTELDKNTIDTLVEPLMHIIRNCADHGIEVPDFRKKSGKSESGTIKLSATYSGNHIIIRIEDDGSGIDLEKVRNKAVEKGILKKSDKPSKQELLNLIFLPGFTTAKDVSEVSGRGVGMDIVKKRISELRGTITIESNRGSGTSFIIKLNQSMSIVDTLLFQVQDSFFILPLSDIVACELIEISEISQRKHILTIPYNNQLIPFVDLRNYLNLDGSYSENSKLLIVHFGEQSLAIIADKILGEHQAVLKPLNKTFDSETIISSVSQLGNGKIAFLIDLGVLTKQIAL
jgi:two-component system, chemotaxis family, sensor kinase CheA